MGTSIELNLQRPSSTQNCSLTIYIVRIQTLNMNTIFFTEHHMTLCVSFSLARDTCSRVSCEILSLGKFIWILRTISKQTLKNILASWTFKSFRNECPDLDSTEVSKAIFLYLLWSKVNCKILNRTQTWNVYFQLKQGFGLQQH